MQVTVSLVGVFICLVSLTTAAAETTSSSTAQASSASSSTTQAAVMQRVYNETSCGSGLAGGYWPVEDLNSSELKAYAALALAQYTNGNSPEELLACMPDIASAKNSIRVDAACRQVVAGTNYIIAFHVEFPCRVPGAETIERQLLANMFVPLPMSENAAPEVISVVAI
ncbi:hypothetical protein Ndes2526B_g07030 [Nannochloris sp. 'desiccata']|nr:hypothetical protein KSW81_004900 [Chlorella desiccata (nom. nud.)]KAH7618119.1 hypothetical protein NADE_000320 [Chlorella desiccata (nom. nud.)]